MKTRIWQALVATTLLALLPASHGDDSKTSNGVAEPSTPANAEARQKSEVQADTRPATDVAPAKTPAPATQPATDSVPATPGQAAKLNLPPVLDQVVRLSKSGTDEAVIRAYVEKAASPYLITGNDIIQLQEMGVSKGAIMALIDHSKSATTSSEPVTPPPAPTATPQQTDAAVTAPVTPPNDAVNDYRDALAPYGTWANLPGYGWCWQPTVVVVNPGWRPYCDNGGWAWTDYGWYWNSYYSWGWAPFHYGRWFSHANRGWYWCPDRVWGPSWVSWRNSASHCGWAPLPPGACFTAGVGWTHHGARVGVDFGFGLGAAHFTFVAHDKFVDRHVGRHSVAGRDVFQRSTVVNNYAVGSNNRIVNQGIGRERIAAATGAPIRETAVRDLARGGNQFARPTRVNRVATSTSIAQPNAQRTASGNPAIRALPGRSQVTQPGQSAGIRTLNPAMNQRAQSRAAFVGGNAAARALPSAGPRIQSAPPVRNWNAAPVSRGAPAGDYRSFARPAAPAPVTRSLAAPAAKRSFASPSFAARPTSAGGVRSGGNVSRGAMASAAR